MFTRVAVALLASSAAFAQAHACSAVLVGKNASTTGFVLMGHNEDDGGSPAVRHGYVPARDWPAGAVLVDSPKCAKVPRGAHTLGFFWTEVRNAKSGWPNAIAFCNEKGVMVATDNGGKTMENQDDPSRLTDGGIWFGLRLAVAERATSARDGVRIIGELVEKWGYVPSGRIYVVADRNEGWLVQVVSGRHWVAMRCPDDSFCVMPNHYTIHALPEKPTADCMFAPDIVEYAVSKGWWKKGVPFDFAAAYQAPAWTRIPHNTLRQTYMTSLLLGREWKDETYPFCVKAERVISPGDVRKALSSHPAEGGWVPHGADFDETPSACRKSTVESFVCEFGPAAEDTVLHIAGNRPCETGYRSFKPLAKPLTAQFDDGDAAGRLERFFGPDPSLERK